MNWDPDNADPKVGTFMPGLRWVVSHYDGPILELGAGMFSTPYLHDQYKAGRQLVSYEQDKIWADEIRSRFDHPVYGSFHLIPEQRWAIVLVDCEGHNRQPYFDALKPLTEVFVIHDTQYPFVTEEDLNAFKFRYDFDEEPRTTLVSDLLDVGRMETEP